MHERRNPPSRLLRSAAIVLAVLAPGRLSAAATTIDVSTTVVTPSVKRLGVNLGYLNFWDSGQYKKEIVILNPGFEGELFQSIVTVATGGSSGFVDDNPWTSWPDGFWNGARYEVVWGAAVGDAGIVMASTAPTGSAGTSYQIAGTGASIAPGDLVVLRKERAGDPDAGWWPDTSGGGTIQAELADLPPGTAGRQAVRLAAGAGQRVELNAYTDTLGLRPFMLMNGDYRLAFSAKGAGAVEIWVDRGSATFLHRTVTPGPAWTRFQLDFRASETGMPSGGIRVSFMVSGPADLLLDDVALQPVGGDPANRTAFRDSMVAALAELRPGILRDSDRQMGDSLDNQIAPPLARQRNDYSAWSTRAEEIPSGLHEFLELCLHVGAEPWWVFPVTFSDLEMANLVEYLAGPETTPYGSRRAARGRRAPWTDAFPTIHLELGNEAWNSMFAGATIEDSAAYGGRGDALFTVAKASPYYVPGKLGLVLGGQSSYVSRNVAIHNASDQHDALAVAPYVAETIDSFATDEELFGPLFAEPEMLCQTGEMRQNYDAIQGSSRPVPLAVYETHLHTTWGSISQPALDRFVPSVGAGIGVANHMLMMMRDLRIRDQMIWALTQYQTQRDDGKWALLWGIVLDMGVTDRKRPLFLATAVANEAIAGDMVRTTHAGDDPTWYQPPMNGVSYPAAHYLQSYAFSAAGRRALIVFNLHRTSPLVVDFSGPNAPQGAVVIETLTSGQITDDNEDAEDVRVDVRTVPAFDPAAPYALPPYSMTAILWGGGNDYVAGEGLGPSNGNRVRVYRPDAVPTAVDFQAYGAGNWGTTVHGGELMGLATDQILTGPGPGPVYGPHVRGFGRDGAPMANVSFFAYGTLRFGVLAAGAALDGDAYDEILTGAGPGAVFGPHVRAFDVDGGAVTARPDVNFFGYGTLRYGINPRGGDVDGDGDDEIVTGPGPGAIFAPHVRGFDYDGAPPVTAIAGVNFVAFPVPQYGANVDAGDADRDGFAEIAVAPGPGPGAAFPSRFLGFDYDATAIAALPGFDRVGFPTSYGGRLGLGDLDGDGAADLVGGAGRDPVADSTVKGWRYAGSQLTALPGPFLPFGGSAYGVNVAVAALGH